MTEKNQPNKKCPFCAEDILSDAVKCKHCGEWLKKQTVDSSTEQKKQKQFSKVVPTGKFILLSVITFGIYELVWFYRNWNLLKEDKGLKISPFWRAFFAPFFAGSIAGHLQKYLKEKDSPCDYSPGMIGLSYFIIFILWRLPDPYWLISFFTFIPMLPLVNAMNSYWQKEEKNLALKNFNWWQIILIVLAIIWLILGIVGTFMPE